MASRGSSCKCWCFTYNNYSSESIENIKSILELEAQYFVIGREVSPTTHTLHLQGYVQFKRRLRFKQVKDRLKQQVHVEVARGSARQNFQYCTKSGNYIEGGSSLIKFERKQTITHTKQKITSEEVGRRFIEIVGSGRGLQAFQDEFPHVWLRQGKRMLENYYLTLSPQFRGDVRVLWIHGPTGTGKTKYAHNKYPDAYIKCSTTKWWCGYQMEKEVIIDEFCKSAVDLALWLTWFQPYKCQVEFKGGHMPLCANRFIVTSNYTPDMLYGTTSVNYSAFLRRIKILTLDNGTRELDEYLDREHEPSIPLGWK